MLLLLSTILGASAVFFATFALATPVSRKRVDVRLGRIAREETLTEREEELARPFLERVGTPSFGFFRAVVRSLLPSTLASDIEDRLRRAGEPTSLHAFVSMELVALGFGVMIVVGGVSMGLSGMFAFGLVAMAAIFLAIPFIWIDNVSKARKKSMQRALPDAADLIVTMVEAGMSIDSALAKVAEDTTGPLAEELRFTMRETTLGRARKDALLDLVERTAVPELRAFMQSIVHAQATGVPLGKVLRTQSHEIRLKKRQRAEESARKAPVKVLVVMIFFVMPALMLTLLGPALIRAGQLI